MRLDKFGELALDFLLPQTCLGCGREGAALCSACAGRMPRILPPMCLRCGLPQAPGAACPDCSRLDCSFDGLRSPFRFERLVREAVHQLKYQNLRCIAGALAGEMAAYLQENVMPADVLMPVPLHPKRLRERGYNQSALLATELGRIVGLEVDRVSLIRVAHTAPQARAGSAALRRQNRAGAFECQAKGVRVKRSCWSTTWPPREPPLTAAP